jgi:hypothetical protein
MGSARVEEEEAGAPGGRHVRASSDGSVPGAPPSTGLRTGFDRLRANGNYFTNSQRESECGGGLAGNAVARGLSGAMSTSRAMRVCSGPLRRLRTGFDRLMTSGDQPGGSGPGQAGFVAET